MLMETIVNQDAVNKIIGPTVQKYSPRMKYDNSSLYWNEKKNSFMINSKVGIDHNDIVIDNKKYNRIMVFGG